jgi:hypothetical protein
MILGLWIALIAVMIVTLVACTWMLVRKFIRLLAALGDLLVKPAILDGVHRAEPEERPLPAVLQPRAEVAARYNALARARAYRRSRRSEARRERALALISAKPTGLN